MNGRHTEIKTTNIPHKQHANLLPSREQHFPIEGTNVKQHTRLVHTIAPTASTTRSRQPKSKTNRLAANFSSNSLTQSSDVRGTGVNRIGHLQVNRGVVNPKETTNSDDTSNGGQSNDRGYGGYRNNS